MLLPSVSIYASPSVFRRTPQDVPSPMHIVVFLCNSWSKHTYHDTHSSDCNHRYVPYMVQDHVVEVVHLVPCSRRNPPASCCSSADQGSATTDAALDSIVADTDSIVADAVAAGVGDYISSLHIPFNFFGGILSPQPPLEATKGRSRLQRLWVFPLSHTL